MKTSTSVCTLILALGVIVLLTGCLAGGSSHSDITGTYVSSDALAQITPNNTRREFVEATLGQPSSKKKLEDGREIWRYFYTRTKKSNGYVLFVFGGSNTEQRQETTVIQFTPEGVVEKVWQNAAESKF